MLLLTIIHESLADPSRLSRNPPHRRSRLRRDISNTNGISSRASNQLQYFPRERRTYIPTAVYASALIDYIRFRSVCKSRLIPLFRRILISRLHLRWWID